MVQQHRIYILQLRKGEQEHDFQCRGSPPHSHRRIMYYYDYDYNGRGKQSKANLRRLFALFALSSLSLATLLLAAAAFSSFLSFMQVVDGAGSVAEKAARERPAPCPSVANDSICCDRTSTRADICFARGDVRMDSASGSFFVVSSAAAAAAAGNSSEGEQTIRPYTRKWETSVMSTIDEITLRRVAAPLGEAAGAVRHCDVRHDVPAVVFSTGGYTGNVYHEFDDGILPLFVTSRHLRRRVVFVILEYHSWWMTKYGDVISRLSAFPPIDFANDRRVHCFPEVIAGLRIHGDLIVDSNKMPGGKTIRDFRKLLDDAYRGRVRYLERRKPSPPVPADDMDKPKLVIVSRSGSRAIENEADVAALAAQVGFRVRILRPDRTTELCKIYRELNASDAMVGVHGAAMTHFLFMRPGTAFIQVVPLGTDWAADTYYGEPASRLGLWYVGYKILAKESSLYREYPKGDPVLTDPKSVANQGWQVTKRVYLDRQNVRLDLVRFRKRLVRAHQFLVSKKKRLTRSRI